jgi:hypothetical protein
MGDIWPKRYYHKDKPEGALFYSQSEIGPGWIENPFYLDTKPKPNSLPDNQTVHVEKKYDDNMHMVGKEERKRGRPRKG